VQDQSAQVAAKAGMPQVFMLAQLVKVTPVVMHLQTETQVAAEVVQALQEQAVPHQSPETVDREFTIIYPAPWLGMPVVVAVEPVQAVQHQARHQKAAAPVAPVPQQMLLQIQGAVAVEVVIQDQPHTQVAMVHRE